MKKKSYTTLLALIMAGTFSIYEGNAQTPEQIKKIVSTYDTVALKQIKIKFIAEEQERAKRVSDMATQKGWSLKILNQDGSLKQRLADVTPDGRPVYISPFNADASKSTRAVQLNTGGSLGLNLNGKNYTVYVWDAGVAIVTHQEYDGPGGNDRFSIGDGAGSDIHSAHVTGTIMASGDFQAQSKGMAPQSKVIGYDEVSDLSEAASAVSNGMILSNHSYGRHVNTLSAQEIGSYQQASKNWDTLMFFAPYYLLVTAAGNDGLDSTSNTKPLEGNHHYDKLSFMQTSKNSLVVANAYDAVVDASGNLQQSVNIYPESSQGPTDDSRIKPDITGNGYNVYSTDRIYNIYTTMTGTSQASPNVAGTLLLLQEHANNVFGGIMKAATLKGLALHTADDAGIVGPDAIFGWGLLNAKKAATAISQSGLQSIIQELTLSQGQTYTFTGNSDGVNPLMASISWTDRAGTCNCFGDTANYPSPRLVNDLDIRVTKSSTTYYPYKLTSVTTNAKVDNNVDPYERVDVSGATGTYTVTVSHKGTLTGGSQNYSLIITGLSPNCVTDITIPDNPTYNNPFYTNVYHNITISPTTSITATANKVFKFSNTATINGTFSSGTTGNTLRILPTPCQ